MNDLNQCEIPGVNQQKQIELFTKWNKHSSVEHQAATCPDP